MMYSGLQTTIDSLEIEAIPRDRIVILETMVDYVTKKIEAGNPVNLNFICTHNSRRSQLSQIWAQTAADYYGIEISSFSGGIEVTAFNERAVACVKRNGFEVASSGEQNPQYTVKHSPQHEGIIAYSKLYDDPSSPQADFAAIMTCDHADENCPNIVGCDSRIALRYSDPKAFDDTTLESQKYDERSLQIATEMFYVFGKVAKGV